MPAVDQGARECAAIAREPAGAGVSARSGATAVDAILARLLALHPKRIDLSLDRIERLLAALDHPERKLPPLIHVAGTNGKGSTIAFMRAILEAAGKRVHVYTSPNLVRLNERFRIGARGRRQVRRGCRAGRGACRMRSQERRRADHGVRDRDRRGVCLVRAQSRRHSASRSRARRPARRHQCGRASARERHHAGVGRSPRFPRRHHRADRRRKSRHPQARRAGGDRQPSARGAGGDRAAGRPHEGAAEHRRRELDRDRGTRAPGLSGQ